MFAAPAVARAYEARYRDVLQGLAKTGRIAPATTLQELPR